MSLTIKTTGFADYLDKSGGLFVKCLILGQPDVGKTRSASFWPKPIFADCEQGRMSIADRKVPYGEVHTSQQMDELLDLVRKECLKPVDKRQFLTFVVDTFDAYQRKIIAERLRETRKESLSGWGDWGYLDAKMMSFLERLMSLPMNIVVNLHTKDITEDDGEKSSLVKAPRLKGDIKDQIFGEFDLVGHMETSYTAEKGKRILQRQVRWHGEPKYPFLKDRSGQLPKFTDIDFTANDYQRIFDAIVSDHMESFAESETLMEIGTPVPAPAPADTPGGPVDVKPLTPTKKPTARKLPTRAPTVTAKQAAANVAAKGKVDTNLVTDPEPNPTPLEEPAVLKVAPLIPDEEPSTDVETAKALVTDQLGGQELATEPEGLVNTKTGELIEPAEVSTQTPVGDVCGVQPPTMVGKFDPVPGCGRSLEGESRDRLNIAVLRTHTKLCSNCFAQWKQAS